MGLKSRKGYRYPFRIDWSESPIDAYILTRGGIQEHTLDLLRRRKREKTKPLDPTMGASPLFAPPRVHAHEHCFATTIHISVILNTYPQKFYKKFTQSMSNIRQPQTKKTPDVSTGGSRWFYPIRRSKCARRLDKLLAHSPEVSIHSPYRERNPQTFRDKCWNI